jgi:exonuclease SbcD
MRILHTADWHVGKTIARQSRLDEHRAALREVAAIARDQKVDAVLVCGDVYEHQVPLPESETIVFETLLGLEMAGIPVVIIPGNHDAPKRWEALAPLLRRFAVRVVPKVLRPNAGGVVELSSRDGSTTVQIAALPWVSERYMVSAEELIGLEAPGQKYADRMARLMQALAGNLDPTKCTMFAGHLFVAGAALGGGERSLTTGETYAVTAAAIPQVQYAALGHVHRPQRVKGSAVPARFAGSLLQLDFSETGHAKSISIVDLTPGLPAQVAEVPICAGRRLRDVAGTMEELSRRKQGLGSDFLRVTLKAEAPHPGQADAVRELLPNAIQVAIDYPRTAPPEEPVRGLDPRALFALHYKRRHGVPAPDALLALFSEVLDAKDDSP